MPKKDTKRDQGFFGCSPEVKEMLRVAAKAEGRSVSNYVEVRIIEPWADKMRKRQGTQAAIPPIPSSDARPKV